MQITKERLEFIRDNAYSEERREMARQLLASMEQEPVGITDRSEIEGLKRGEVANVMPPDFKGVDAGDEVLLYAAPQLPQPAVVDADDNFYSWFGREWHENYQHNQYTTAAKQMLGVMAESAWRAGRRAAMLQGAEPVSQPYTLRDGYCIMPMKLTAENGAKGALSGEFSETKFINCPECFGDDECETCDGSGRIEISVPVSWTTIKEIWAKGVEHFAAAPQQEVGNG